MAYRSLVSVLSNTDSPTVWTLPDGSIDHYCRLAAGGHSPIHRREALLSELANESRSTYRLDVESIEPGGQAVNVATQLGRLGANTTCVGHLDDPIFEESPFDVISMGAPADVYAFNFDDGDVMIVDETGAEEWSVADLRRVCSLEDVLAADAVCSANWISYPGLESVFEALGEMDPPNVPFFLDPGDVVGIEDKSLAGLAQSLDRLGESVDVIYNGNRGEIRETAEALANQSATSDTALGDNIRADTEDDAVLAGVREAMDITATVMHAADAAAVVTEDERVRVEAPSIDAPSRHTGGGDRFAGGLAYGAANGWDWETALACGNACAAYYVSSGTTATPESLAAFLEETVFEGDY
jgi:sugar/nucleoside kinase (ribokinase family)